MNPNDRGDDFIEDVKQQEKVVTDHGDAAENNVSDIVVPQSLSALTSNDPSVLTTIFEPSKIKNFLYKVEPNIARINASSLDLISTTAALMLQKLVEKAVLREQDDINNQMYKKTTRKEEYRQGRHIDIDNENQDASVDVDIEHFLLTSNHLKRVVSANNSPSLDFLEETYESFRDKDGSVLPSRLHEYVPRKATKRSAATVAGNVQTTTLAQLDYCEEGKNGDNGNNNKKLKIYHRSKDSSSLLLSSNGSNDADPLERAIANAANAEESHVLDEIVEDDDDYD
jgi:predicted transcriptional regulator